MQKAFNWNRVTGRQPSNARDARNPLPASKGCILYRLIKKKGSGGGDGTPVCTCLGKHPAKEGGEGAGWERPRAESTHTWDLLAGFVVKPLGCLPWALCPASTSPWSLFPLSQVLLRSGKEVLKSGFGSELLRRRIHLSSTDPGKISSRKEGIALRAGRRWMNLTWAFVDPAESCRCLPTKHMGKEHPRALHSSAESGLNWLLKKLQRWTEIPTHIVTV